MKIKNALLKKTIFLKSIVLTGIMLTASFTGFSQTGVGINATGAAANASAMLDVTSTSKGVLFPRMTAAQRNAIPTPAIGLTVYNTDINTFDYYNGIGWVSINPNGVTGSGTQNYIPKWNNAGGTAIGNSQITDNGTQVVVGTVSNPEANAKLDVVGNNPATDGTNGVFLDVQNSSNQTNNLTGIRFTGSSLGYYLKTAILIPYTNGSWGVSDMIFALNGTNNSTLVSTADAKMIIKSSGNVGIGTTTPNAPLQFPNTLVNRKIVLYETANNDNQYYGFGINGGTLRYQVDATTADHVFYAGTSATTSNELMRIKGNGSVAIGVPSYSSAALNLKGTFMIEDAPGDQFFAIRRAGLHRWQIKESATTGLTFGQLYNDAGTNQSATDLEILDNGNVEIYNNLGVGVAPGVNYNIYTTRPSDFGPDHTGIYSARTGTSTAANGGTSWAATGVDAALKSYNTWGNNYSASAYFGGYTDYPNSAIQMAYNNTAGKFTAAQYQDAGGAQWGLYVQGNVSIVGNLAKSSGTFKIDHPLDPANKYLNHSFVESPDMMNVYNGNISTDASGMAEVTLPDYFEALNKDFRYQLTVIGDFSQVIVFEKIINNKFKIKTDKPNIEVSWQVTGIRKDPYAEQNRIIPVVDKTNEERGKYLYPAGYGQHESMGIGYSPREERKPTNNDLPHKK